MAGEDHATDVDDLAAALGVTRERVHQLEASARRKIAVALANDGPGAIASGGIGQLKQRASRRTERSLIETPG
jgi:predicted DNA-binding protein (UPF0251 family)